MGTTHHKHHNPHQTTNQTTQVFIMPLLAATWTKRASGRATGLVASRADTEAHLGRGLAPTSAPIWGRRPPDTSEARANHSHCAIVAPPSSPLAGMKLAYPCDRPVLPRERGKWRSHLRPRWAGRKQAQDHGRLEETSSIGPSGRGGRPDGARLVRGKGQLRRRTRGGGQIDIQHMACRGGVGPMGAGPAPPKVLIEPHCHQNGALVQQ